MKLLNYNDMEVSVIRRTVNPGRLVRLALDTTMKKADEEREDGVVSAKTLLFLLNANHGSVLEHVSFTFHIKNVSRAFLAQITRHRMASYTSASQHYQDYRDYPMVASQAMVHDAGVQGALEETLINYAALVDLGFKPEEARMLLPNASCVNLIWTVNARSFANFVSQRGCRRNVQEMRLFATVVKQIVGDIWPEFGQVLGPDCATKGLCFQGRMSCGTPYSRVEV